MSIQNTSNLTNAIGVRYTQKYIREAEGRRLYDQLAVPIGAAQVDLETRRGLGTTYSFNFLSGMQPGVTAMSESSDIVPQILRDAVSTIAPTSLGEALKWTELLDLEVFTDYIASRAGILGENAMESIENLAITAAMSGALVYRAEARATLDASDSGSRLTEAALWAAKSQVESLKLPLFVDGNGMKSMLAIVHPDAYYDLFHGGNVFSAIEYGGLPGNILFNGEIGSIAGFKILSNAWAKVLGGAGEDHATGSSNGYYLTAAAKSLDKTLTILTGTNLQYGRLITVGVEETSTTMHPENERVRWISGTTTATIVGSGANGGLRFDHPATSTYGSNNDSVYPVIFGGPGSLVKVYANEVGEFGKVVGPKFDGLADQWQSLAWKFYGGYGLVAENRIARGEYVSSLDDI